ncbi:hypothetical protein GCM10027200_73960 [Lentzea nigeriaca]
MWRPHQQLRLAQEEYALRANLPGFSFHDRTGSTYVSGWWQSNTNRTYEIRLHLPRGYPDEAPSTYVSYPTPLMGFDKRIEAYGTSHAMHTYETDRAGWVKVCIVRPEDWSAAYSVIKVLRKAMLWITAYECHLDDGRPIENFLM